jgi:hypothetical protein
MFGGVKSANYIISIEIVQKTGQYQKISKAEHALPLKKLKPTKLDCSPVLSLS